MAMELHQAARAGDMAAARQMLAEPGLDVNSRDTHNRTPLHLAAWAGQTEMVQLLCEHNAAVGATAVDDMSALHFACQKGHTETVRTLLAAGAKANSNTKKGFSPLHYAVQGRHLPIIRLIARRSPQLLNLPNKKGQTPKDLANSDEVQILLKELEREAGEKEKKKSGKVKKPEVERASDVAPSVRDSVDGRIPSRADDRNDSCDRPERSAELDRRLGENPQKGDTDGGAAVTRTDNVEHFSEATHPSDDPAALAGEKEHRIVSGNGASESKVHGEVRPGPSLEADRQRKKAKVALSHLGFSDNGEDDHEEAS